MKDVKKLLAECCAELDRLGISYGTVRNITVNTRAKSRWGLCKKVKAGVFDIDIAAALLEDSAPEQMAKDTVMHELLHTVPDCFGHKGRWKLLAQYVNSKLPQYNVKRVTSYEEKGVERDEKKVIYRYVLRCTGCGQEIYRQKESKVVTHYKGYRCARCGGRLERIK